MNSKYEKRPSVFKRAIKYSVISASIIILFLVYRMLTTELVGTTEEIIIRFVIGCVAANIAMYIIFVIFLYFNPDADKSRSKE
jgi:hypothetical protein